MFARGKVLIYVIDTEEAAANPDLPKKLTDSKNLCKFVSNVLPKLLAQMQRKYGWADLPRTVVHDKASYFVPPAHNRLQKDLAQTLHRTGFRSWVGEIGDSAGWMVKKFGDVYLHETVIAHIRRLLDGQFAHSQLHECPEHFTQRMQKVEDYMNSSSFSACGGRGLMGLAKDLRTRCEEVRRRQGERIPK